MHLYYKVLKDSDTGKKFAELIQRGEACAEAAKKFLERHGFTKYRPSRISYNGGISACASPKETPNPKIWKKAKNGDYMPRCNTNEGRAVMEKIEALPIVDIDELNNIVGYDSDGWKHSHIGFLGNTSKSGYYGFIVFAEWNVKVPADCIEITGSEYTELSQLNDNPRNPRTIRCDY